MFPILRQHWTLWAAWTGLTAALLFANPWGSFGWAELVASLGSLILTLDSRTRRESLLAVGLPLIVVLAMSDSAGVSLTRLLVDWFVLIGAALLGARAVDDQRELESIAGHLAIGMDAATALREFETAVDAEIARSRRHDRNFVVLSIAPHPSAVEKTTIGHTRVLRRLTLARSVHELAELLGDSMHRYAQVVATEKRALCLAPELDEDAIEALVRRLGGAATDEMEMEIQVGVASFPADALTVDDLIEAADRDRERPVHEVPTPTSTPDDIRDGKPDVSPATPALVRDAEG